VESDVSRVSKSPTPAPALSPSCKNKKKVEYLILLHLLSLF